MKKLFFSLVIAALLISPTQAFSVEAATNLSKDPNYNTIYKAMVNLKPIVNVKYNDYVFDVFNKVIEDHPEIFYIDYDTTLLWTNGKLEIGYNGSTKMIKSQVSSLNKKVNTIYNGSKSKKTTKDKIKYFHDYIINHAKYDIKNYENGTIPESSYNAYGVLVKGVGVCQGYAESMKILLDKAKIPNYFVVGFGASNGYWIDHAWNLVKLGRKYYHVDSTWDDPITTSGKQVKTYNYFLINDSKMRKDHKWNTKKYPKAI
ncbi:transglutaminase domain-containing protein [Bacillus massilinigeriensis]|uniref:transglutaminase domain-containing protein n=1 Tax=Bacillus massilionigeriensis TaxID=1805475 RepID=UPI00096B20AE|nr:transglutaminase domain-containing protein [Bacillus massilionigeriensis]